MTKYTKQTLQTTTDCLEAAQLVRSTASAVNSREKHAAWWDDKVELLNFINDLLGTGGFEGVAYEELMAAKLFIHQAEKIAGQYPE